MIVKNEYEELVEKNKKKYIVIQNEIKSLIQNLNNYFPATIMIYNKIINTDNISKDDALTYLIDHKTANTTNPIYFKCEYCDAYTIVNETKINLKCCNCGSNLKITKKFA